MPQMKINLALSIMESMGMGTPPVHNTTGVFLKEKQ